MKVLYDVVFVCSIKTTCEENDDSIKNKEIIEFGGCLLNVRSLQTSDPFSVLVKPQGTVSNYCTKKTGIAPEDLSSGVSFIELVDFINEFIGVKDKSWASYGTFAQHVILNQCNKYNLEFPFSDRFFNVKSLMPMIYNLDYEISLREAIRTIGISVPQGDSRDDAINTAIVLKELLRGPNVTDGNFVTCEIKRNPSWSKKDGRQNQTKISKFRNTK